MLCVEYYFYVWYNFQSYRKILSNKTEKRRFCIGTIIPRIPGKISTFISGFLITLVILNTFPLSTITFGETNALCLNCTQGCSGNSLENCSLSCSPNNEVLCPCCFGTNEPILGIYTEHGKLDGIDLTDLEKTPTSD